MAVNNRLVNISILLMMLLIACKNESSQQWEIGGHFPMKRVLVDLDQPKDIKICSDEYKNIGFPVNVNIDYDDQRYYGLIEGLCITVRAKKLTVKFATPSSGKKARGTFEILQ